MSEHADLTVLGAGISGLGVALEAALCGAKVVLVERGNVARAASGNSLRIIHGGLRYLQKLNAPRLVESVRAQAEMRTRWPELVRPLACALPVEPRGMRSKPFVVAGAALYRICQWMLTGASLPAGLLADGIAGFDAFPDYRGRRVFRWTDMTVADPHAFASALREAIVSYGGELVENAEIETIGRDGGAFTLRGSTPGGAFEVRSPKLCNATGAWVIENETRYGLPPLARSLAWAKAFNIVVRIDSSSRMAVGAPCSGNRLLFCVPRDEGLAAVGTWYVPYRTHPEAPATVTAAELGPFLDETRRAFPRLDVSEIVAVEAGILPCEPGADDVPIEGRLLGREEVSGDSSYVRIVSTKYTTFIPQARRALEILELER